MRRLHLLLTVSLLAASALAGGQLAAPAPASAAGGALTCPAPAAVPTPLTRVADAGFVPSTPVRVADTRNGIGAPTAPIPDGCVLSVDLAPAGPPAGATAVALTITSDRAAEAGYVTAYGCASPRPLTSSLNPRPADPTPNLLVVALDSSRQVCFYSDHTTDLIVDVTGWFTPAGTHLHDLVPERVFDSRRGSPRTPPLAAGTTVPIPLAGSDLPAAATAVAVTVTLTGTRAATYATAFPCGTDIPPTSTTNALAGRDRGTAALVGLGADGALCVYVSAAAHLVVDVTGWFGEDGGAPTDVPGSPLAHLATSRLADSRAGAGGGVTRLEAGVERRLEVIPAVPVGTTAVQLDLLVVDPAADGFLSAYPCGTDPLASALNYPRRGVESALVTVPLGTDGSVCLRSSAATDYVVDLFAAFGAPGALHALRSSPAPDQGVRAGQVEHTVHCPPGGTEIPFSVQPAPGVSVAVDGGPALAGAQSFTRTLTPDGALTMHVTGPGIDESHLVRCLPPDFPRLAPRGVAGHPGWYLASSLGSAGFVFILDEYGVPVWYKRTSNAVIGVWPLSGGKLAWRVWTGGGFPGGNGAPEVPPLGFEIHDITGAKVGDVGPVGGSEPLDWHELLELPGGGHLVIVYTIRNTGQQRACSLSTGGSRSDVTQVVDSELVELDASGNQVWRWNSKDHTLMSEMQIPICFKIGPGTTAANWALDYMHVNSVDRFDNGDYLIGARHFNAVERISHATGEVTWKLGGTAPKTGTLLTILGPGGAPANAGERPAAPHDGRISPTGTITMHDNHLGSNPRASEYRVDPVAGTAQLIWQFVSPNAAGGTLGSVRREDDGSTVIGWGEGKTPWLEDVGPGGTADLLVDLLGPELIYRAVKVPPATWTREQLRAAAGGSAG